MAAQIYTEISSGVPKQIANSCLYNVLINPIQYQHATFWTR